MEGTKLTSHCVRSAGTWAHLHMQRSSNNFTQARLQVYCGFILARRSATTQEQHEGFLKYSSGDSIVHSTIQILLDPIPDSYKQLKQLRIICIPKI